MSKREITPESIMEDRWRYREALRTIKAELDKGSYVAFQMGYERHTFFSGVVEDALNPKEGILGWHRNRTRHD